MKSGLDRIRPLFNLVKTTYDFDGICDVPLILKAIFVLAVGRLPTDKRKQVIEIAHQDLPILGLQTSQLTGFPEAPSQFPGTVHDARGITRKLALPGTSGTGNEEPLYLHSIPARQALTKTIPDNTLLIAFLAIIVIL